MRNLLRSRPVVVLGIGHAGLQVLRAVAADALPGASLVACDTDVAAVRASVATTGIELDAGTDGRGAGGRTDRVADAVRRAGDAIGAALEDAHLAIVVGGLGGGTGGGAMPAVCAMARERAIPTAAFATLPFELEGRQRQVLAREGWDALAPAADVAFALPGDRLPAGRDASETTAQAFQRMDLIAAAGIRALADLLVDEEQDWQPEDVAELLRGAGAGIVGTAPVAPDAPLRDAVRVALREPLSDLPFASATTVLVHLRADADRAFAEIGETNAAAREVLGPDARIEWVPSCPPSVDRGGRVTAVGMRLAAPPAR